MNNTERFDKWVREEINSLDTPLKNFQSEALWQKMQAELRDEKPLSVIRHPLIQQIFVTLTKDGALYQRSAAVVGLLLLAGIGWWLFPASSAEVAENSLLRRDTPKGRIEKVHPSDKKSQVEKQYALNVKLLPQAKVVGQVSTVSQTPQKEAQPTEKEKIKPIDIVINAPSIAAAAVPQNTDSVLQVAANELKIAKPKFKIVHANELADYQRAEIAEIRAKEAEKQGFVVINWQQKQQEATAQTLRTFIRNQSSKSN